MIVQFIYFFFEKGFHNPGLSIAAISVAINLIALPLYNIANALQEKERDVRIKMQGGIQRIKDAFKGDEQYMMLSTYYRQNNYHPTYVLRSSVTLLIQVPFFIAAYHFLSNLEQLQGESFALISDLGSPDALLNIGSITLNFLPILMTVINIIAGIIYTKGFPLRDKIQLYGMAGLFLVLLYTSPAGLVLYWTLNNSFSLIKNIFYKFKNPLKMLYIITVIGTIGLATALWIAIPNLKIYNRIILCIGTVFIISSPIILHFINLLYEKFLFILAEDKKQQCRIYLLSGLLLFLLCGVIVPSNLISSSPIEFSFTGTVSNPLAYIFHNASIFFGLWIVWALFIYVLSNKKIKTLLTFLFCGLAFISLFNVFVFKGNYGTVNQYLRFEKPNLLKASYSEIILPFLIIIFLIMGFLFILKKGKAHYISMALTILCITSLVNGVMVAFTINKEFNIYEKNLSLLNDEKGKSDIIEPVFHLSQKGKNIIYIFLDRAISGYFPLVMEQFPELKDQFKGFVFYPNTVSYGPNTLLGSPPMVGGYEYTPEAMNLRSSEKLVDKHNEALLVLPKIFLDANYSITITDPPFSNYQWSADFTPFNTYTEMKVMKHLDEFSVQYRNEFRDVLDWSVELESKIIKQRLLFFSLFKTALPITRLTLYDHGNYFSSDYRSEYTGIDDFIAPYSQLYYLDKLTDFSAKGNTYNFISNNTTHEPVFLQAPEYEPRTLVTDKSTPLDNISDITTVDQIHYHANAAALKQLGRWFEQLQNAGIYDNSRIIIVADHGRDVYSPHFDGFKQNSRRYTYYNPLHLTKDFHAKDFLEYNNKFMTNADAALFAVQNLDVSTINPFTKQDLFENVSKEVAHVYSGDVDLNTSTGNLFKLNPFESFSVHDSIFVESNWSPLKQ